VATFWESAERETLTSHSRSTPEALQRAVRRRRDEMRSRVFEDAALSLP